MPFFPQQNQFFELFNDLAATVNQASHLLTRIKIGSTQNKRLALSVQKLELKSSEFSHLLKREADRAFITPIDREDIHALANSFNAVLDHIENVASSFYLLNVKTNGQEFKAFTELIEESTTILQELAKDLTFKGKYVNRMKVNITTLHQLEKKGNELTRTALMKLFLHTPKPLVVIKWKYIYDDLEKTLNACEMTADTFDEIIIKNF